MKKIDLSGKKFGRWTVLQESGRNKHNHLLWLCQCACGKKVIVLGDSLRKGRSKSCGCFAAEQTTKRNYKHGDSKERLYKIWWGIKMRTTNPKRKSYPNYGGRGIKLCDEWLNDYLAFRNWALSNGYSENLSIDRIDVNGNYEPLNCRWATDSEQANNQTSNNLITHNGQTMNITQWSKKTGIPRTTISARLFRDKKPIKEVLSF